MLCQSEQIVEIVVVLGIIVLFIIMAGAIFECDSRYFLRVWNKSLISAVLFIT